MSQINVEEALQRQVEPYARRNMTISIVEGLFDAVAMGMIPLTTVVTYFISDYVNNSFLLGLLPTLQSVCNALVQILLRSRLNGIARFKRLCNLGTALSRVSWLILSILILFFSRMEPLGFVCVFYGIYCFNGLCQGITSSTYTQMMNKVIPNRVKGRFFGVRGAFTSAAGIVGAQIGGAIIAANGDVRRFGVLFGIAFVLDMISVALQGAMVEPALRVRTAQDEGDREARPSFFSDAKRLIRADKNLARYVAAMFLITIGMSFFNFQTAQSKDALGLTGGQLGIVTTILYVSQTAGNLLWGWFADRQGYRPSLLIGQAGFVLYLVLAFLARDAWLTYIMTAIYGLANALGSRNMVFHLCPYEERVGYYSLINMALTISAAVASMITGALIDWIGYEFSALACLGLTVPGLALLLQVRERPPEAAKGEGEA